MIMDLVIHVREMIEEEGIAVVIVIITDQDNVIVIKMMIIDRAVD